MNDKGLTATRAAHSAPADDSKVATTAEIKQKVNKAMQFKRTVGFMIPNVLATDPGAMTAWSSAAQVEVTNKKKPPTP